MSRRSGVAGQSGTVSRNNVEALFLTKPEDARGDIEGIFIKSDNTRTVFGVGTKTPYSRISMGQIDSPLEDNTPSLAFTEDQSGNYASGISFFKNDNNTELSLKFSINKLSGYELTDLEQTTLHYDSKNAVLQAPVLTISKVDIANVSDTIEGNSQLLRTGQRVFINCSTIPGTATIPAHKSGLIVNGFISLTDRLNFFNTSIVEGTATAGQANSGQTISLYHENGGYRKELLTRTGQNRVIDASHTLISVLPNSYTGGPGPEDDNPTDPSGLFIFKNCDFVIGNGEMAAAGQAPPDTSIESDVYWERFKNISTSFLNLRGNTFFGSVFDISSAEIVPILSKAYENIDYSRNGVLYLQNNLGIGSYQPRAVIDCSKVDLPLLMMGREITGISNNTIAFGDELNIPLANYSFIFGKDHDLSGSPQIYKSNYNFLFGKNIDTSIPNRLNYNFIYGKNHNIQGDYNFLFGDNHRLAVDVSYCTLLGKDGIIDSSGANSAVMKYTLGQISEGGNGDIFVLTRQGDLNILKDICCNDISSNTILVKNIGKTDHYTNQAYITDFSGSNIDLIGNISCIDISATNVTATTVITDKIIADEIFASGNSIYIDSKKTFSITAAANKKTLNIDASYNIILNTNNTDNIFINEQGDFSIGADNRTIGKGKLYAIDNNTTITANSTLLEGLQFGKDGDNDYYLRLASDANKKTNIEFGITGSASTNKIVYDDNENSLNTYYDGSYNIYNGATNIISIDNSEMKINAALTLTQSELTTKDFTISNGGRIYFENQYNKIQYTSGNFNINTSGNFNINTNGILNMTAVGGLNMTAVGGLNITGQNLNLTGTNNLTNTYTGDYSIFNSATEQFKLNSSELNINTSTKINNSLQITGNLIVAGKNVGDALLKSAGGSAWAANKNSGIYVNEKVGINIKRGNLIDNGDPFNQFLPKFDLDISGNLRTFNMLLGRSILNMVPFNMVSNTSNILNNTYSKGDYTLNETRTTNSSIWHLFDNGATYWESEKSYINKDISANITAIPSTSSISIIDSSNNYDISETNISLSGEEIDITFPQLWTLKYYGFKPAPGDLSKNMPSKWYVVADKGSGWKLIDEKDISNLEQNYFQEDKYYYFNLDPSNNFARDNYTKFGFIFNQIFNDGEDTSGTYLDISCNIGGIQLFGELNDIPDFSANIIQTELQNNGVNYDDISHINQKKTKHLSLQPFGGRVGINNMIPKVILDISANDAVRLPVGDNSWVGKQSGSEGDFQGCIRFNTYDSQFEGCDGQNWGGLGGVISLDQQTKITAHNTNGIKFITNGIETMRLKLSGDLCGNDVSFNNLWVGGTNIVNEILDLSSNSNTKITNILDTKQNNLINTSDICCNDISCNGDISCNDISCNDIIATKLRVVDLSCNGDICGNDVSFNNLWVGGTNVVNKIQDLSEKTDTSLRITNPPNIVYSVSVDAKFNNVTFTQTSYFFIDGVSRPILNLIRGMTYKFDQSDSTNNGHPLRLYTEDTEEDSLFELNVTYGINEIPESNDGVYTLIKVTNSTPDILYYKCSVHWPGMGNSINIIDVITTKQNKLTNAVDISCNDISCNGDISCNKVSGSSIVVNGGKVDLSNASMVIVPQLSQDNSSNNVATTGYVRSAISDLIGGAPDALDTLKELSTALSDDSDFATTITNQISLKQDKLTFNAPSSNNANPSTSAEIKTALDLKANLASPIFTGIPKITVDGTDINIATTTDVNNSAGVWTDADTYIHYSNKVSIGANVNVAPLAIVNTNNFSFLENHDKGIYLGINSTNNPLLQFVAAADQSSYLDFKDITNNSDHYKGRIEHNNTSGFSFYTNKTKCIDITTAGQISFGQSVPSSWTQDSYPIKMDVTGNIRCDRLFVSNKNANGDANGTFQDIESLISGGGSGAFTVNGNDIYYNTGNVGIGTNSPGEKLSVNGSIQITGSSSATVTNESKIIFTRDITDTDESENIAKIYTGNNVGPLVLESSRGNGYVKTIGNSSGTNPIFSVEDYYGEKFRICGNGNVGIGTTIPKAKLHIEEGNINIETKTGIKGVLFSQNAHARSFYIAGETSGAITDGNLRHLYIGYSDTSAENFVDSTFTNGAKITLLSSSNGTLPEGGVGIGTTLPRATLNVSSNLSNVTESQTIPNKYGGNSTTTCVLGHGASGGTQNYWGLNIGTTWSGLSYIQVCHINGTSFYELLLNPKGGNVGIGKETTNYKLDVNGTIGATGNITAYYSDERLKTFKGKITQPIEKIKNLNGYYFVENELAKSLGYNNDKLQVGVSAQEVEAVLPEIVTKAPIDEKYKTVWYEKLTPLLIEGIKAQQTQIESLETQMAEQQVQMAEQQVQIDELKALVQSLME